MTGARTRGVIIPLPPQTCGNLAIVERDTYAGQAQARRAAAERYRQRQRRVQAARRQRIAATIAVLLVAGLLAAFMPWRGADKPAQQVTDKLNTATLEEGSTAAPYQFAGYSPDYPATEELKALAADVLTRYHAEKNGEENVGRVLPAEYCFFTGDGEHNYFTIGWKDTDTWGWTLESPYKN